MIKLIITDEKLKEDLKKIEQITNKSFEADILQEILNYRKKFLSKDGEIHARKGYLLPTDLQRICNDNAQKKKCIIIRETIVNNIPYTIISVDGQIRKAPSIYVEEAED